MIQIRCTKLSISDIQHQNNQFYQIHLDSNWLKNIIYHIEDAEVSPDSVYHEIKVRTLKIITEKIGKINLLRKPMILNIFKHIILVKY